MKVLQWNIRGYNNSTDDLHRIISRFQPDMILLQETWTSIDSVIHLPGMRVIHLPRKQRSYRSGYRGGLLIAFRDTLPNCVSLKVKKKVTSNTVEILAIQAKLSDGRVVNIANCYFAEGCTEEGLAYLRQNVTGAAVSLTCGDFNARHSNWDVTTNDSGTALAEWAAMNGLSLVWSEAVAGPTFETVRQTGSRASHPDLVFCSDLRFVSSIAKISETTYSSSDHTPILFDVSMDKALCREVVLVNYKKAACAFAAASSTDSPNSIMDRLGHSLRQAQFNISKRTFSDIPKWWTPACSEADRSRKALRKRLKRSFSSTGFKAYQLACSNFRHIVTLAKRQHMENAFASVKVGSRDFFRLVQRHKAPLSSRTTTSFTSPAVEVERLALELEERWKGVDLPPATLNTDIPPVFSEESILEAIHSVKNSAPGEDYLTRKGLLEIFAANPDAITSLINCSFSNQYHHPSWNKANIIMIPKKDGSKRPISVTSCMSKVREILWLKDAKLFADKHSIFRDFQVGFRKNEGTLGPASAVDVYLRQTKLQGKIAVVVALDLTAAYCNVPHEQLLRKMRRSGAPSWMVNFIHNHLRLRKFQCSVAGVKSKERGQRKGIPQGCVSSPFLFNWYLADFPEPHPYTKALVYADDILFISVGTSLMDALAEAQGYLAVVELWCSSNQMTINTQKSEVMVCFADSNYNQHLYVGDEPLKYVDSITYLGVTFERGLRASAHVTRMVDKALRATGCYKRLIGHVNGLSMHQRLFLYRQYIRPILEYGSCLQRLTHTNALKLDRVERKILKQVLGLPVSICNDALYLETGLVPLSSRSSILAHRLLLKILCSPLSQIYHPMASCSSLINPTTWRYSDYAPVFTDYFHKVSILIETRLHIWQSQQTSNIVFINTFPDRSDPRFPYVHWPTIAEQWVNTFAPTAPYIVATDGSVSAEKAGCAVVTPQFRQAIRLPDYSNSFEAECIAIDLALDHIITFAVEHKPSTVIIFSDCRAALFFLQERNDGVEQAYFWTKLNKVLAIVPVYLVWVPGHVGIALNEAADQAAKAATRLTINTQALPLASFLPKFLSSRYQRERYRLLRERRLTTCPETYAHLRVSVPQHAFKMIKNRTLEWAWIRFRLLRPPRRICNARFASPNGYCLVCPQEAFDASHFLFECPRFAQERQMFCLNLRRILHVENLCLSHILSCGTLLNVRKANLVMQQISSYLEACVKRCLESQVDSRGLPWGSGDIRAS